MLRLAFSLLLLTGCPSTTTEPSVDDPWYCQDGVSWDDADALCQADDDVVIDAVCPGFWDAVDTPWQSPEDPLSAAGLDLLSPSEPADFIRVAVYSDYRPDFQPWYQDDTPCWDSDEPDPDAHAPYWTTEQEWGTACGTATDEAACLASLDALEVTGGFADDFAIDSCTLSRTFLIVTSGDSITVIESAAAVDTWLGALDNAEEVALARNVARQGWYASAPDGGWVRSAGEGAWNLVEQSSWGSLPIVEALTMTTVDVDGRTVGRTVVQEVLCNTIVGR